MPRQPHGVGCWPTNGFPVDHRLGHRRTEFRLADATEVLAWNTGTRDLQDVAGDGSGSPPLAHHRANRTLPQRTQSAAASSTFLARRRSCSCRRCGPQAHTHTRGAR
jgi:hypothetical protein